MTRLTLTITAVVLAAILVTGAYLFGARSASGLAAFTEAGVAATVGQEREPWVYIRSEVRQSIMGKKM